MSEAKKKTKHEFKQRIAKADLLDEVCEKAERETDRLRKMPPMAAEAVVVRTYLEWLLALPWNKVTEDRLDLDRAQQILNEDHYGLKKVKERILEYLAVRKLVEKIKGPILCLVGPPVGKISTTQSIMDVDCPFLGGAVTKRETVIPTYLCCALYVIRNTLLT